jgi:hypothetical protein
MPFLKGEINHLMLNFEREKIIWPGRFEKKI